MNAGALIVMRKRTGRFAAEEVALLQTFATQSALAIQNARLFREIEDKSRQRAHHGGRIWVKSEVGAGSTFTFTIPTRRGE